MPTEPQPVDFEVLPPERHADHPELSRLLAWILDDLIPIPGTKIRIGLDPIIGLLPGVGDSSTAVFSSFLLVHGLRAGVPRIVMTRMALNIVVNTLLGAVPVAGDVFSAWFKSNQRNYTLLREHVGAGRKSTRGDWIFVCSLLGVIAVVTIAAAIFAGWVFFKVLALLASA